MSTLRSQTIEALEKLARDAAAAVCQALAINESIRASKLPIPLIDPMPIFNVQRAAEVMLVEMQLKARRQLVRAVA